MNSNNMLFAAVLLFVVACIVPGVAPFVAVPALICFAGSVVLPGRDPERVNE